MAITSTVANTISEKYNKKHPELSEDDPLVLLAGFRAAGWVCCGVLGLSALITLVGWRGVGLVGQSSIEDSAEKPGSTSKPRLVDDIEMGVVTSSPPQILADSSMPASSAVSINTAVEETSPRAKKDGEDNLEV